MTNSTVQFLVPFSPEIIAEAKAHALAMYPQEACGIVSEDTYFVVPNLSSDPNLGFEMPPNTWLDYAPVQGVLHSHTLAKGGINVSKADMEGYLATGVPWGVCLTDGTSCTDHIWLDKNNRDLPLIGRPFIPGIWDCFSLGLAHFWQELGIEIKDYPRDAGWWDRGENMFVDHFLDAGFVMIPKEEAQVNDVLLMAIGGSTLNHCAIVLGGNMILHHLTKRLSRRDIYGNWIKMTRKALRYAP